MIETLEIEGGLQISGEVEVSGAKNSALPLLFATLLTAEPCVLENVPDLEDVEVTLRLLSSLGSQSEFFQNQITISTPEITGIETRYGLVKALRASFWALGPLLARAGEARVALPGGDAIGSRPVDLHLKGLVELGASVRLEHGVVIGSVPGELRPAKISLAYPSVGATHHLLMTAALIPGETILEGAASEAEVVQLAELLCLMGAEVEGAGTRRIRIHGSKKLGGARLRVLGDRIEATTYLMAAAATGGDILVRGLPPESLQGTLQVLRDAGCDIEQLSDAVRLSGPKQLRAVSCQTEPHPGLATDAQPLLMAGFCVAQGKSRIRETVFDNRFGHVAEYRRFGAQIELTGNEATVLGCEILSGAPVQATDIRAAAGLVLMGLLAHGETQIGGLHHLDRGYDGFEEKLRSLGARIFRLPAHEMKELVVGC